MLETKYTIENNSEVGRLCNVKIQNDENEIVVSICYGQGEMDNNKEMVDIRYFSGLEIDNIYYGIKLGLKKIAGLFPTTYKEIISRLNGIADKNGLECIE